MKNRKRMNQTATPRKLLRNAKGYVKILYTVDILVHCAVSIRETC